MRAHTCMQAASWLLRCWNWGIVAEYTVAQ